VDKQEADKLAGEVILATIIQQQRHFSLCDLIILVTLLQHVRCGSFDTVWWACTQTLREGSSIQLDADIGTEPVSNGFGDHGKENGGGTKSE
jgi:hypothetical protein